MEQELREQPSEMAGIGHFPRLPEVLRAIEVWRSLDLQTATFDEVAESLRQLRKQIGRIYLKTKIFFDLDSRIPGLLDIARSHGCRLEGPSLWRVQKVTGSFDEFHCTRRLWAPDPVESQLNRCNNSGNPLLYCSLSPAVAIRELSLSAGDKLVLIEYRIDDRLKLTNVFGDPFPCDNQGRLVIDSEELRVYHIVREFVRREFARIVGNNERHLYMRTAAFCQVMAESEDSDGWRYRSIVSPSAGHDNVALQTSAQGTKLNIRRAYLSEIDDECLPGESIGGQRKSPSGFGLFHLKVASLEGCRANWRDLREDEPEYMPCPFPSILGM